MKSYIAYSSRSNESLNCSHANPSPCKNKVKNCSCVCGGSGKDLLALFLVWRGLYALSFCSNCEGCLGFESVFVEIFSFALAWDPISSGWPKCQNKFIIFLMWLLLFVLLTDFLHNKNRRIQTWRTGQVGLGSRSRLGQK